MALKSPSEVHGTSETCGRLRLFNLRKEERDAVSVWDGMRPPDTAVRLDSSYSAASGVAGCRPGCVHRVLCQHRRGHEPSLSICAARRPGRLCSHGVWDSDPGPRAGEGSWRDWLTGAWARPRRRPGGLGEEGPGIGAPHSGASGGGRVRAARGRDSVCGATVAPTPGPVT